MSPSLPKSEPCPHMGTCEMYSLFKAAHSVEVWKINYCNATFSRCARYQAASRGEIVPVGLLPNGQQLRSLAGAKP